MPLTLKSPAFKQDEMIPKIYTCDGEDISPPLQWSDVPGNAKSLALICDDPDAPMGTWDHWILFNIPASENGLEENIPPHETLENGAKHGINDFKKLGYGGPCPPDGKHRYFFKLYALDSTLSIPSGVNKEEVENAMKNHIIEQTELMGLYSR